MIQQNENVHAAVILSTEKLKLAKQPKFKYNAVQNKNKIEQRKNEHVIFQKTNIFIRFWSLSVIKMQINAAMMSDFIANDSNIS